MRHVPDKVDPACEIVNEITHESIPLAPAHLEPPQLPAILTGDGAVEESQLVVRTTRVASAIKIRQVARIGVSLNAKHMPASNGLAESGRSARFRQI